MDIIILIYYTFIPLCEVNDFIYYKYVYISN